MRRLLITLLAASTLAGCRERTDSGSVSAPSAVDVGDTAKTKIDGDAAAVVFQAFAGKAPLNKDTGDFFHFTTLSCQAGKCTATLAKAGHEMLLASGDVASQMKLAGSFADQASQALAGAGANPADVKDLCCLTDGIKFACSFAAPAGDDSDVVTTATSGGTATATTTTTATSTDTSTAVTTIKPKKNRPITGACYCGLHSDYCMIFKYGDEFALGYRKATTCTVAQCQQNFSATMIDECERVWRVWPVE